MSWAAISMAERAAITVGSGRCEKPAEWARRNISSTSKGDNPSQWRSNTSSITARMARGPTEAP